MYIFLLLLSLNCQSFSKKGLGMSPETEEENPGDHLNTTIKKKKNDENYRAKLVKRRHNSHVHREGGVSDKAYYTYYSHHPSSRHSQWSFHEYQHGVPRLWKEKFNARAKGGRRTYS